MNFTILYSSFINIIKIAFVNTNVFKNFFFIKVFTILKSAASGETSCTITSKTSYTANGKTPFTILLVKGLN